MDHILWLARIFGPFLFIVGLWAFFRTDEMEKVWSAIKANPAIMFCSAVINLLVGLGTLSTYSTWSFGLPVLLTLFGWAWVIRGVLALFVPEKVIELTDMTAANRKGLSLVSVVWGLLLIWVAFF